MVSNRVFFETLFPTLSDSFIEFRLIKGPGEVSGFFLSTVASAEQAAAEAANSPAGFNTYFGVCPRSERSGTKAAVKVVHALWADVDGKDFPEGKPGALAALHAFQLPPTVINDSANGYHAFWRLRVPILVNDEGDIASVEGVLKSLARALGADGASAELARVLRVPGTLNFKDPSNPVRVTIIDADPGRLYELSDFAFLGAEGVPNQREGNEPGWVVASLARLEPGNRNDTFARIAGRLHHGGWTSGEILMLLSPHAERTHFPPAELEVLVEGLCQRYPAGNPLRAPTTNSGKPEAETRPLKTITPAELLSRTPNSITWRVQPILPAQGVGILAGPAGYGKSWALLDLAIETALGGKWLGHFQTVAGRVLYIDEESSEELSGIRLRKLLAFKAGRSESLDVHFCVGQSVSLSDPAGVARLRALLAELRPSLVIVDSLIRVHRAEENSASDMAAVFGVVKELVREFDCAFYFADHQRKAGAGETSLDTMLRGSTEKAAFVDSLLSMKKTSLGLIVEHSKSRFAEPVGTFVIRIEDPVPGSTRVSYAGDAEELKREAMVEEARPFIEGVLGGEDWVSRQDLVARAKEAKIKEVAISATLKLMVLEGSAARDDRPSKSGRGNKAAHFRLIRGGAGQAGGPGPDAQPQGHDAVDRTHQESVFDFPTTSSEEPETDSEGPQT
jgi:hypothetical protein